MPKVPVVQPDRWRIQKLRNEAGLTQEQLAKRARCATGTIEQIECGSLKRISVRFALTLARIVKADGYEDITSPIAEDGDAETNGAAA